VGPHKAEHIVVAFAEIAPGVSREDDHIHGVGAVRKFETDLVTNPVRPESLAPEPGFAELAEGKHIADCNDGTEAAGHDRVLVKVPEPWLLGRARHLPSTRTAHERILLKLGTEFIGVPKGDVAAGVAALSTVARWQLWVERSNGPCGAGGCVIRQVKWL
jgi:hypothetical protein